MIRVTMRKAAMDELGAIPPEYAYSLWHIIFKHWPKQPPCHPEIRLSSPRFYFVILSVNGVDFGVSLLCPRDGDCAHEGDGNRCPYSGTGALRITSISSPLSPASADVETPPIWLIPND